MHTLILFKTLLTNMCVQTQTDTLKWKPNRPRYSNRVLLTPANKDKVMRSPKLAAIGVATLSGLIPTFLEPIITPIITRPEGQQRMLKNQWPLMTKFTHTAWQTTIDRVLSQQHMFLLSSRDAEKRQTVTEKTVRVSFVIKYWKESDNSFDSPVLSSVLMFCAQPKESAATKAVVTLLAHNTAAWSSSTPPREKAPSTTAASAAKKPTTVAWTWREGGGERENEGNHSLTFCELP